jgi:hypothetical protein
MSFTSSQVKAMVAGYFRYKQRCPIVAFEASDKLEWATGEPADILVVTESRMLYEIEVKISIADLKQDAKKNKHRHFATNSCCLPVYKFYFAVPQDMADAALGVCNGLYPYAGLLSITKFPFNSAAVDFGIDHAKSPKRLNNKPLPLKDIVYLVREQSGTLCRLAREVATIQGLSKELLG